MNTEEFVKLVADMRNAQKAYFKSRRYDDLERARSLERSVDKAIKDIEEGQQSLFG
ncbi:MAG: hypothetical protein SPK76_08090 [Bacteroidales bacterium]|nr:hypothetical protein [Bacteroidales bacterium]MDY6444966.1 hypothetical protein [Bacteroidales bacterium]